ncbi:MAG: serine/threonine protein kinase [Acidobacteria bacterium]|nr:MAG: serine/threonine protein kinase [Acidobacteriota bacterium]
MDPPTGRPREDDLTVATGDRDAPAAADRPVAAAPRSVGRWQLLDVLGEGGMGTVYRASDPLLSRQVAVKLLHGADPRQLGRFLLEARSQARIDHENVCRVFEAGVDEGRPFIVMQLVEGTTLREASRSMSLREKVACVALVAEGVHAAHRTGLIHRDLKPTNVMVERDPEGRPKPYVLDFGLARDTEGPGQTASGHVVGTPSYMAPEQAQGESERVDRRTDVYGLGAVLYEVLTGRPPFAGPNAVDVMMQVLSREAPAPRRLLPSLPKDLETITRKCLEKEPERRYDTARALAEDLGRWLDGEPISARPPSLVYLAARKARKHRAAVGAAAVVLAALALLGALALRERSRALSRARLAQELGEEAARVGDAMRVASLLPLHDVRAERERLERRVEGLSSRLGSSPADRGPVLAARGRGELALGRLAEARDSLLAAWDAGFRSVDVARDLGLVHASLYQAELRAVARLPNPQLKRERRQAAERALREPARRYLREGASGGGSEALLARALLDFCEERWDAALAGAARAVADEPALFEALRLTGEVLLTRANAARERGETEAARAGYEAAASAFEKAAGVARSDPESYLGIGTVHAARVELEHYDGGGDVEPWVERAERAYAAGLTADPDHAGLLVARSDLLRLHGESLAESGRDPSERYEAALADASRVTRLDPRSEKGWKALAIVGVRRAEWEQESGRDPRPELGRAVANLEKAAELGATDPATFNALGYANNALSEAERARGGQDSGLLRKSVEAYERALAIAPSLAYVRTNLGNAFQDLAGVLADRGEDPRPAYARAEAAYREALAANPGDAYAQNSLGNPSLNLALIEAASGRDPEPHLARAEEAYRKAAALNPRYATPWLNLGWASLVRAQFRALAGASPGAALKAAREAFGRGLALKPGIPVVHAQLASLAALEARWLLSRGESPLAAVRSGRLDVARALATDPGNPAALSARAELALVEARFLGGRGALALLGAADQDVSRAARANPRDGEAWLLSARVARERAAVLSSLGRDARGDLAAGRDSARKARTLLHLRFEPDAEEGAIALLAARAAREPAARTAEAGASRAAFARAFAGNPLLQVEYGSLAAEAARLAASPRR